MRWDKARALLFLVAGWAARPQDVFYAGDDVTDECVFEALAEGFTVKVGDGPTAARYIAADPDEIYRFVRVLIDESS